MKKPFVFIILILSSFIMFSQVKNMNHLRMLYFEASYNENKMDSLMICIKEKDTSQALFLAYQGATEVMKAKYSYNPFSQISYIKIGTKHLKNAFEKDPNNFEIRFLRFAIEYHLPSILGMSDDINDDKIFLLNNLSQIQQMKINTQFGKYLYEFLEISKKFNSKELQEVKNALTKYCLKS